MSRLTDQSQLEQRNAELQAQVDWLNRQFFGRKSERTKRDDPNQLRLFDPPDEPTSTPDKINQRDSSKKKRRGGGRRIPPPGATIVERIHDLPEDERRGKVLIGEEVSYTMAIRPAEVYWIKHIQRIYAPARADPDEPPEAESTESPEAESTEPPSPSSSEPTKPRGPILRAPKPREGPYRCLADASLLAYIGVSKFADHLPIHRQAKILGRSGADLSESTMNGWILSTAELMLPLTVHGRLSLLKSFDVKLDETTVKQQQPGKPWTHQSFFWVYYGGAEHPFVFVDYQRSRSAAGPQAFFGDADDTSLPRPTYIQCDGYCVYDQFTRDGPGGYGMVRVGCWAHARRYFEKAINRHPRPARHAMELIGRLYRIERQAKDMTPIDRAAHRLQHAPAVIDELVAWCRETRARLFEKDPLAVAIDYLLPREADLRRYLEDGRLTIDNNACERTIRPLAIGRKNWLFVGNEAAGRSAAVWLSLIGSCQRVGVDPFAYLTDVIRRLPTTPAEQLPLLLPHRWQPLSG